jgi:hypothetical protein
MTLPNAVPWTAQPAFGLRRREQVDALPSVRLLAAADQSVLGERATLFTLPSAVLWTGVLGLCGRAEKRDGYVVTSSGSMSAQSLIKAMTSEVVVSSLISFGRKYHNKISMASAPPRSLVSVCGGVVLWYLGWTPTSLE